MDPGLYDALDADQYHASPGVSVSRLKRFAEAPAKVKVPRPDTPALAFGSLIHTAVLEPHLLERQYFPTKLTRISERDKATQAEMLRAAGRELVKESDYEEALAIARAVHDHPVGRDLLAPGHKVEQSFYWRDARTGLLLRGRCDLMRRDMRLLADVKSAADASPEGFARAAAEHRYFWQDPMYRDGVEATDGWEVETFLFLAVEKEPPYLVGAYLIPPDAVEAGREQVAEMLDRWAECERTGIWPGYGDQPQWLEMPRWIHTL